MADTVNVLRMRYELGMKSFAATTVAEGYIRLFRITSANEPHWCTHISIYIKESSPLSHTVSRFQTLAAYKLSVSAARKQILGRPRVILLGSTVIGIGAIIQTCSWTVASMMVGRIVAGLGTGMNTATAGVWQAETSKMNSRGKLVIIQMGEYVQNYLIGGTDRI